VRQGISKPDPVETLVGAHVGAALEELEAALGHGFASRELLLRALTHRSLANELAGNEKEKTPEDGKEEQQLAWGAAGAGDNERLEFLGDAVLGLVVAEALFRSHPDWKEGELTRVRSQLVSRQRMGEVAAAIGLGNYLRLSRSEDKSGLRGKANVLSNTMEAVMGAMFLDGGLEAVRVFTHRHVMGETAEQLAQELRSGAALGNYKSALQEHLQAARAGSPVYRVRSESGPDHCKRFLVEVRLRTDAAEPGKPLARGVGGTKKHAEQDAARRALVRLMRAAVKAGGEAGAEEEEQTAQ
jgi:ribonuclease-3